MANMTNCSDLMSLTFSVIVFLKMNRAQCFPSFDYVIRAEGSCHPESVEQWWRGG